MKSLRNLPFHTRRDAWVEVNLAALEHNTRLVCASVPKDVAVMAVVKADAYGHGTPMILSTLEATGVQMVGVAAMDEALQIRQAGFTLPILVLGATPDWAMQSALDHDIQLTVFADHHIDSLRTLYQHTGRVMPVQIKIDTGMHRIGVAWETAAALITRCQQEPALEVTGVFTHLAHTVNRTLTEAQWCRWQTVLEALETRPRWCHVANSAETWHGPLDQTNMVRVGISFFGYPGDETPLPKPLKPVMGLKARIVHLHTLPPGEGVSYNQTFQNTSPNPRRIATLPLGYADGVPRGLSNRIHALYQNVRVPQVGNITMDQLMLDVTDVPDPRVGDVVTLLGGSEPQTALTLTDWAQGLQTIEYELMCGLRVRLPKVYVREG